jgi:hypothetical protein
MQNTRCTHRLPTITYESLCFIGRPLADIHIKQLPYGKDELGVILAGIQTTDTASRFIN